MIYQVINLKSSIFYKKVVIKNLNTGKIEQGTYKNEIFTSQKNRLKIGNKYKCKIFIFGQVFLENNYKLSRLRCMFIEKNYVFDNKYYAQIAIGINIYYISMDTLDKLEKDTHIFYLEIRNKEIVFLEQLI